MTFNTRVYWEYVSQGCIYALLCCSLPLKYSVYLCVCVRACLHACVYLRVRQRDRASSGTNVSFHGHLPHFMVVRNRIWFKLPCT